MFRYQYKKSKSKIGTYELCFEIGEADLLPISSSFLDELKYIEDIIYVNISNQRMGNSISLIAKKLFDEVSKVNKSLIRTCVWAHDDYCVKYSTDMKATGE